MPYECKFWNQLPTQTINLWIDINTNKCLILQQWHEILEYWMKNYNKVLPRILYVAASSYCITNLVLCITTIHQTWFEFLVAWSLTFHSILADGVCSPKFSGSRSRPVTKFLQHWCQVNELDKTAPRFHAGHLACFNWAASVK